MNEIKEIELVVYSEIKTKGRPRAMVRGGYAHMYTPNDTVVYENLIKMTYREKYGTFKFETEQPLVMFVDAYFKMPKNLEKYSGYVGKRIPFELGCTKHKDVDNIAKVYLDALHCAYDDDKTIVKLVVAKHWTTEEERVEVLIKKAEELPLDQISQMQKMDVISKKINELQNIAKPTKAQEERLKKLQEQLVEGTV